MKRVVTFGEIMLRLSPSGHGRFVQADSFDVVYGGGEANVTVSLANYGLDTHFVTKVPDHEIGQCAVNSLRRYGVGTGFILRGGERLGIYFLEHGASQRPSKVIYDRAHSAISQVKPGEFHWHAILEGADWFHFTGITPALGKGPATVTLEAVQTAKELGVTVSADLNYRKKLWSPEEAKQVMSSLMPYVDVLVANEEDADKVFGITAGESCVTEGKLSEAGYQEVALQLVERFGFKKVAITLRESLSASVNNWSGLLYNTKKFFRSRKYEIQIVDRVGAGDSFAAGLIYGLVTGMPDGEALEFAAAASCLKHTILGDFNLVSTKEVQTLAAGDQSGRVQR